MKTILAYRFSALGDVAMLSPVMKEFLAQNTEVQIILLSRAKFAPLFEHIDRLTFQGVALEQYKGILGIHRLARELYKKYRPDLIGDFHDVLRTQLLNLFYHQKGFKIHQIDKGRREKKDLTNVHHLEKHPLKQTIERYADVFRGMGFNLVLKPALNKQDTDRASIGFAPFAKHIGKMLPLEKSYQLAKKLAKEHQVLFFGGGSEEVKILQQWEKEIPNTVSLAGKFTLSEELQRMAKLKLMISMDSANMHLASLVGTRVVSIWGNTHPYAGFLGYGQRYEDCVQITDLTCRPCSIYGQTPCFRGDYACLHEITVPQILKKVKTALSE